MDVTKTYQGKISVESWLEQSNAVLVGSYSIACRVSEDMEEHGRYLTVRWAIANQPVTLEESAMHVLSMLDGVEQDGLAIIDGGDLYHWEDDTAVKYFTAYSEITGYLWTEENLQIGGHDMLAILRENEGRFLVMEIDYSTEPFE